MDLVRGQSEFFPQRSEYITNFLSTLALAREDLASLPSRNLPQEAYKTMAKILEKNISLLEDRYVLSGKKSTP